MQIRHSAGTCRLPKVRNDENTPSPEHACAEVTPRRASAVLIVSKPWRIWKKPQDGTGDFKTW
jgi:hypothetical protein